MSIYVYVLVMAVTTYLVRDIPLNLLKKPIRSRFLRSFLHYVPTACLTAMTFPAILEATQSPWAGAAALVVGIVVADFGWDLFRVALSSCAIVLILELFL